MTDVPSRSDFSGKVAAVTGGGVSPGRVPSVGEACSRLLAARGAKVAVIDIDRSAAEATVARIEGAGGVAIAAMADLAQEDQCRRAVQEIVARWDRLDVLVNNVGIGQGALVTETVEADFDAAVAVNMKSALFMAKYALPQMTNGGAVVNLSTSAVLQPSTSLAYSATKSALEALTLHIAFQFGPDNIRCNTVRPGEVWTGMVDRGCKTEAEARQLREERARRCVLPHDGDAWDIANAVAFLASEEARWITGQTISVDGGAPLIRPNPEWRSHRSYGKASKR